MGQRRSRDKNNHPESDTWPIYQLFGLNLASNFTFTNRLIPGQNHPDLLFYLTDSPFDDVLQKQSLMYTSPYKNADGRPILFLYGKGGDYLIRFTNIADFYFRPDRIACHLVNPAYHYLIEIGLLGTVMALFLEAKGQLPLHGSSISIGNSGAAAFLADKRGGKSSLAASFLQEGYELISDDILVVAASEHELQVHPSYPQMRLEPAEVEYFFGTSKDFERVHPDYDKQRVPVGTSEGIGQFCTTAQPLKRIYLLERKEPANTNAPIAITPISRTEAMIELMRHSFEPEIAEAMGFQGRRLQSLAALTTKVPVRRLTYPTGFSSLPDVRRAIERDVSRQIG